MTPVSRTRLVLCACSLLIAVACSRGSRVGQAGGTTGSMAGESGSTGGASDRTGGRSGSSGGRTGSTGGTDVSGEEVTVAIPEAQRVDYAGAKAALAGARPADASAFLHRWTPRRLAQLPYDPAAAVNLALVQSSNLKLNTAELNVFKARGFVISGRQQFATFFEGYRNIYVEDLPVFVSADAVLHAVHRSYDAILKTIELRVLIKNLDALLTAMHGALQARSSAFPQEAIADVDEYLTIARRLLGTSVQPVASGSKDTVAALVAKAVAATGIEGVTLFGEPHDVDFSQFTPRGHYADEQALRQYFQASMWLGRIDFRLLSQTKAGAVKFHRRPYAAAALMAELAAAQQPLWRTLDETLRGFVGESDNMLPTDFERLRTDLAAASLGATLTNTDAQIAQAIINGRYGIQRIASQLLVVQPGNEGAPLDRSFLLLGQRFVIDSQVLSNVVYDRIPSRRMMPSPLDVGFAALGNSDAAELLGADLAQYADYPGALHDARTLVDQHEPAFWQKSLYGSWMSALRALSLPLDTSNPSALGLPSISGTGAWSRRLLQTQLGSWTELRHDNLLYAKQSYTGIPACEFPDAYVEPVPAVWGALADFAKRGQELTKSLGLDATNPGGTEVFSYFSSLAASATMLKGMAESQRAGTPFTAEQMVFINNAIELKAVSVGCATIKQPAGWYPQLFFVSDDADKEDTIVADVHTQPADAAGNIVGHVLHVGTGHPRLMVATFETCSGPRAYAGLVSAYFETVTKDFERLTDQAWKAKITSAPPATVPWLSDLIVP